MSNLTIADHILFGILAFVLPLFAVLRVRSQVPHIPSDTKIKIRLYWLNSGLLWVGVIVVAIVWWFGGRPWTEMGWRWPSDQYFPEWMILCAWFALLYLIDSMISWNSLDEHPSAMLLPKNRLELLHFSSIVSFSAAFCEEVVFRGFMVSYLLSIVDNEWGPTIAILGSAFVFSLLHAYQGWVATAKIFVLTVLFGWIFVLTGSLLPVIIIHYLVDLIGGMLGYSSAHRKEAAI